MRRGGGGVTEGFAACAVIGMGEITMIYLLEKSARGWVGCESRFGVQGLSRGACNGGCARAAEGGSRTGATPPDTGDTSAALEACMQMLCGSKHDGAGHRPVTMAVTPVHALSERFEIIREGKAVGSCAAMPGRSQRTFR